MFRSHRVTQSPWEPLTWGFSRKAAERSGPLRRARAFSETGWGRRARCTPWPRTGAVRWNTHPTLWQCFGLLGRPRSWRHFATQPWSGTTTKIWALINQIMSASSVLTVLFLTTRARKTSRLLAAFPGSWLSCIRWFRRPQPHKSKNISRLTNAHQILLLSQYYKSYKRTLVYMDNKSKNKFIYLGVGNQNENRLAMWNNQYVLL